MTQKNKLVTSEVCDGVIITTTQGREHEVRVLGTPAELVASRFDARTADLTYRVTLGSQEECEIPFIVVISNQGAADAIARYQATAAEEPSAVLAATEGAVG